MIRSRLLAGRRSYTTPASLARVPAILVPCGFTAGGLPIGLQLIGPLFAGAALVRAAHAWEKAAALSSRHSQPRRQARRSPN
jgi:aspartyl-tRNA(Asn)/glutamyl-tRNA(Gln) amidotransferase subunit A